MIVTGAFFTEAAATVDGKLHVWGGVLDRWGVGPDRFASPILVVLTRAEALDTTSKIRVRAIPPKGIPVDLQLDVPKVALGGENGFVFTQLNINAAVDGRYVLEISGDSGSVSLPLILFS